MKVCLIGMSNVGKSHWSRELEKKGFKRIACDVLIGKKLGTQNLGQWLGQPYELDYRKKSEEFQHAEQKVIEEILVAIEEAKNEDIVVDTGGSVIYLRQDILQKLKRLAKIVYLEAPVSVIKDMQEIYFKNPKSVIWGTIFEKREDETNEQAIVRCYPKLLETRAKKYEELADVTLDYYELRSPGFTTEKFIEKIQ